MKKQEAEIAMMDKKKGFIGKKRIHT